MLSNVGSLITEELRRAKPSPDGMPLDMQLAHILAKPSSKKS
jgi:hypothetical protein